MNKQELAMLERAYKAEIDAALKGGLLVIQTRSKVAQKLVADGLLERRAIQTGGRFPVTVDGFSLTHAGRMAYCLTCDDEEGSKP